jgi:Icc-related predicted phosphoesterase
MDTWAFKREKHRTYKKMIPTGVDILVTHQPPLYNGLGMVEYDNGDIKECGSPKLMERIIDINPELVICGHIHSGNHSDVRLGNIRLYNVALLDEQYTVKYHPKRIIL